MRKKHQMNHKIIFLDIDGVLNSQSVLRLAKKNDVVCPVMVNRLNRLIEQTDAKVVLSSSWRTIYGLEHTRDAYLIPAGFKGEIIDATIKLHGQKMFECVPRGAEIKEWLSRHPKVESFVILDDYYDMEDIIDHLVQTTFYDDVEAGGLQDHHVEAAKLILQKKNKQ